MQTSCAISGRSRTPLAGRPRFGRDECLRLLVADAIRELKLDQGQRLKRCEAAHDGGAACGARVAARAEERQRRGAARARAREALVVA